ncbi:response regulator [Ghiorsea bivora]|uniref:response regulator n=1 Tax=Ghiorsea bivora TaxID=1485545 RepID=UPI0006903DD4|nr:response regulator [Ghiorsea bivora]
MRKTILLIDDENSILQITTLVLEDAGYQVAAFISPTEAITYYKQHQHEIHATILDMTMPEMDGITCAKALWNINAQAIIILSSGYTVEDITQQHQDVKFHAFLQKPYLPHTLVEQLEAILCANNSEPVQN